MPPSPIATATKCASLSTATVATAAVASAAVASAPVATVATAEGATLVAALVAALVEELYSTPGAPRVVCIRSAHRRPPEPEDEAVGRSADERSGRLVVGHLHLIDGEQQVAGLQQATGEREASHSPP